MYAIEVVNKIVIN